MWLLVIFLKGLRGLEQLPGTFILGHQIDIMLSVVLTKKSFIFIIMGTKGVMTQKGHS